ncbi:carboxymuconolactone decarboxylase family protein [Leucobacter sp. OH2974_COT-288]|uniref:AhpD family alkylhydroperoxidase n=1 Tax=Canibacter oris TaxID=1365628 RepID=A0A840DFS5_9MICO|nr:carboxymuconolactone decarboxylase family protein [Canibacter oris]MBB4071560.1 AhpD family alkylhydroperoxidase [Canibacter oris]RRD36355.1 carboxymuconolactone decarboxylase family protein [Leucobacter sp. OH2974_COT-288]
MANLAKLHPQLLAKVGELEELTQEAYEEAGLDAKLVELVKIRVSQLNGCAYCLRSHNQLALEAGDSFDRLAVLPAWREAQCFTPMEIAALALAENVNNGDAAAHDYAPLNDEQISVISWIVITMNAWNRIALHSHFPVK